MKYLSNYTEQAQTDLFNECGAFFAFSQDQLKEGMEKIGVMDVKKLIGLGAGMVCLREHEDKLLNGLEAINQKGIELDLAENGKKAIIHRELANHECQIGGDITPCVEKLESYPITRDEIAAEWREFYNKCIENNWF